MTAPSIGWQGLIDAGASETDTRRKANLAVVLEHVAAEIGGRLNDLLATMTDHPVYRIWGASSSVGPAGHVQVHDHYARMIETGKNRLDFRISRVVCDADTVVTEGRFRFAYPGLAFDVPSTRAGDPIEPTRWYLAEYQCVVLWPIDEDGRISGEEIYAGERPTPLRALADGEHPELGPLGRANGVVADW